MGFSSAVPFLVAHEHSATPGDGGVLSNNNTIIDVSFTNVNVFDWARREAIFAVDGVVMPVGSIVSVLGVTLAMT